MFRHRNKTVFILSKIKNVVITMFEKLFSCLFNFVLNLYVSSFCVEMSLTNQHFQHFSFTIEVSLPTTNRQLADNDDDSSMMRDGVTT